MSSPYPETVDLTNCDREPIHIPGSIQSFGYLISVSSDWLITHLSINCEVLFARSSDDLLGSPLSSIIKAEPLHEVRNCLQPIGTLEAINRLFDFDLLQNGRLYDIAVHRSDNSVIIEFERKHSKKCFKQHFYNAAVVKAFGKARQYS